MVPMRDRFFHRDAELAAIANGLDDTRCVTLVGPGGVGKTRLAREYTERTGGTFWFVALASRDSGIGEAVCAAVNVADRDALDQLLSHLDNPVIVLDNVEHVLEEAAAWTDQLLEAHASARVLVSSREALQIRGETVVQVGPLPTRYAVDLFVERARERGAKVTSEEVLPLVEHVGGLPLVLELAAGRSRTMAPALILERIEHSGLQLLADGGRDRDERHRSVEALVDHSWQLLDDDHRLALAECTAFRGDFALPAAEAVLSAGKNAWKVLNDLVEKSLVEPTDDDRFLLLEPIRMFATNKLEDPAAVHLRHARYYASLGGSPIGRCPSRDLTNLLAAHHRVATRDLRLAAQLTRSAEYALRLRGAAEEMEALASFALDAHPEPDDVWAHASLLRSRAAARLGLHDHEGAREDAVAAVELAEQAGDENLLADCVPVLAWLLTEDADDDALSTAHRGVELADKVRIPEIQTFARIAAGLAYLSRGDWEESRDVLEPGVELASSTGETRAEAWLLILLGQTQERCASLAAALACYERASECAEAIDDATWVSIARCNVGTNRLAMRDYAGAREAFERSLEAARSVGDRHAESQALMGLGRAQVAFGENPRDSFHSAIDALVGLDVWYERGIAYSALGIWELQRHPAIAEDVFRLAGSHVERMGAREWTGMMHAYRACALALCGKPWRDQLELAAEQWSEGPAARFRDDLTFAERACDAIERGESPTWDDSATARAEALDADPSLRLHWLHDNHVRTWLDLNIATSDEPRPRLLVENEARTITLPSGEVQDFKRRGPLRRMLLALATTAAESPGTCLSVEELLDATYPDEQMTFESGRMRIHTSVRRLRRDGFQDLLITRDEGYLLDPEAEIILS